LPSQRLYDLFRRGYTSDDTLRAISRATGCPYQTLLLAAHPEVHSPAEPVEVKA
jgi:hypothetical protein